MIRHSHYLEIPWEMHWRATVHVRHGRTWWLTVGVGITVLVLIGAGVISGMLL